MRTQVRNEILHDSGVRRRGPLLVVALQRLIRLSKRQSFQVPTQLAGCDENT